MTNIGNALEIEDLGFEVLPGGASQPVLHVPAIRVIIAVIVILWPTPAN
jgi:hypothetical protein